MGSSGVGDTRAARRDGEMLDPVFECARGNGERVGACGWVCFRDETVAGGEVERVFLDDAWMGDAGGGDE